MKKLILTLFIFTLFIFPSYAATRTISDAGGNWGDTTCWSEGAVPTSSDDVVAQSDGTSGNVTINTDAQCLSMVLTNYTGRLTHNSGITLAVGSGNITFVSGMTYTLGDNTATITHTAHYKTFRGAGKTFGTVNLNVSAQITVADVNTFATLTITGSYAVKTGFLQLNADQTVTGTFTCNGNSITNRILITSNTQGTARTITAATVSVTNANFQDIAGAGVGSWDLSAVSGGSGDCGGNSGITFTTAAAQYWHADSGNWSNSAKWFLATNGGGGAGRVPLPQDSAVFDANSIDNASQTITVDMPRIGLDINFTGVANSPTLALADWLAGNIYGSLTLGTGMSTSMGISASLTFGGGGTGSSVNLTSNSVAIAFPIILSKKTGTLTLVDDLNITTNTASDLTISIGTFDANNCDVSVGGVSSSNYLVRAITMGSGTWTLTSTGTVWNMAGGGTFTLTPNTSTIIINDASATAKTFAGWSKTYYNLQFTGAGTGSLTVTGSNTFNDITIDTAPKTLTFTAATTTTVSTFHATGSSGNLITINSSTGGSAATLYKAGGLVSCDYLSLQDSAATGAFWFAGANSTNVSGNSGWVFTAARSQVLLNNASLNNAKISR